MSSGYGFMVAADRVGYVTIKTALLGFTRAVAVETAALARQCAGFGVGPGAEAGWSASTPCLATPFIF